MLGAEICYDLSCVLEARDALSRAVAKRAGLIALWGVGLVNRPISQPPRFR